MRLPYTPASLLLRREVLLPLFVVGVVGVGLGMTTVASLQDSDSSTGNAVQGAEMNLNLDGSNGLSGSFLISGGTPGSSASHTFELTNVGGVSADHVEVALSFSENDPTSSEPSDSDLAAELNATETASLVRVTRYEYRNDAGTTTDDILSGVTDGNGNGIKDLQDVREQASPADDLPAPQANSANTTQFAVAVELADDDSAAFAAGKNTAGSLTGYDEDLMADGIDVTVTATLNQESAQ